MKSILSYTFFASLLIAAFSTNLSAQSASLEGDWEFAVQQAPWEYNKGVIHIHLNSDDELAGDIRFHTGGTIPVESIIVDESSVQFRVFVDGYEVNAICTLEEDQLKGHVQTVEGEMVFAAERKLAEADQ